MQKATHQTIKLSKGRHASAADGACVMELASMLAGEPFSDHPRSASPAIAAFLRTYNDMLDDRRRQDLYACAAGVVGTAGDPSLEAARAARLVEWADERWRRRARWSLFARLVRREVQRARGGGGDQAAAYATHTIRRLTDETHACVLRLIDELIALGGPADSVPAATDDDSPPSVSGSPRSATETRSLIGP